MMYPIRKESFGGFGSLAKSMMSFMDQFDNRPVSNCGTCNDYKMSTDINEDDKNFYIQMDVPGISKVDINISVNEDVLTINIDKKTGEVSEDRKFHRVERFFGEMKRSFSLPETTDRENISASVEEGVLYLEIPKVLPVKPKDIEVEIK
jgi:HSP20 family protein